MDMWTAVRTAGCSHARIKKETRIIAVSIFALVGWFEKGGRFFVKVCANVVSALLPLNVRPSLVCCAAGFALDVVVPTEERPSNGSVLLHT